MWKKHCNLLKTIWHNFSNGREQGVSHEPVLCKQGIHPCKYTVSAYSKVGHTSSWNFTQNLPAKSLKHFAGFLANRKV